MAALQESTGVDLVEHPAAGAPAIEAKVPPFRVDAVTARATREQ